MKRHTLFDNLTESDIVRRLDLDGREETSDDILAAPDDLFPAGPPPPAAVLVPLVRMDDGCGKPGWHILYTRRTDLVRHHKGQVSFPGGRTDPGDDSPEATALRESFEEIGLDRSCVRILGRMEKFLTISNYLVTPVIGIIPWPCLFTLEPKEVSRVFTIPIDWLADPAHYEVCRREVPQNFPVPPNFNDFEIICYKPYDGEAVWGATAAVTLRLVKKLGGT